MASCNVEEMKRAGVEALKAYEDAMQQRCAAVLAAEGISDVNLVRQDSSLMSFFDRAPFIKQYFSLHQLKLAVDECTDDDLRAVQRDMRCLHRIVPLARKIITILTSEIPAEYKPARADILRPL